VSKKYRHRTIIFYKDYFQDFFVKQQGKVKDKIIWTFDLIEELPRVPETYLKTLKTQMGSMKSEYSKAATFFAYSAFLTADSWLFCNGFQKKTNKTPKQEIEKALKIKEDYENRER
jgi:phage-related protein